MSEEPAGGTGRTTTGELTPDEPVLRGRLHSSVVVLWSLQVTPALAALLIAGSLQRNLALAAIGVIVLASWIRWLRYRWSIDADQLVIEHGLLQHTRRVIPLERIQAVQAVRKVRHRIFGVVGLRIETVGGSESEGQLDALPLEVAGEVQRRLLRAPTVPAEPVATSPSGTVLAHTEPRMLFVAGLTGGRVGAAAAALAAVQEFAGDRVARAAVSAPQRYGLMAVVVVLLLGVVAAFALSVVATAFTYWDFTVMRDGDLLRVRRGLLAERRDTVPLARVQSLSIEENVVRRALGLAAVKIVVAGRAGEDEGLTSVLLPIAPRAQALALIADVLDISGIEHVDLRPMPPGARARRLARAALFVAAVTAATLVVFDWPLGLLGAAGVVVAVPVALDAYRALGWSVHDTVVVARAGWVVRRTTITPLDAPQSLRVSQSPFQRRRGLATLRIEIARTRGASDPRLLDIDHDTAVRLQHRLAHELAVRLHEGARPT